MPLLEHLRLIATREQIGYFLGAAGGVLSHPAHEAATQRPDAQGPSYSRKQSVDLRSGAIRRCPPSWQILGVKRLVADLPSQSLVTHCYRSAWFSSPGIAPRPSPQLGTGYGYPAYGSGYGTGYAYHPFVRRPIYATTVGIRRPWHY